MQGKADGTGRFQIGLQLHGGDLIVTTILLPVRDWRRCCQCPHPFAELLRQNVETRVIQSIHLIGHERRQDGETRIEQDAVIDGKQQIVDRTVDPARGIMFRPASGGDDQHGALARHRPLTVAVAPAAVAVFADTIGEPAGIDAIHPALEDRGHGEPPERELENYRVGPAQLVLLGFHVIRQAALGEFARGRGSHFQALVRWDVREVGVVNRRFPAHGVEVGYPDLMALCLQGAHRHVEQGAVEGMPFGMGEDDQDIHERVFPRKEISCSAHASRWDTVLPYGENERHNAGKWNNL